MRLVALLCFYDEDVKVLARYVDGLAKAGVQHLVASDGRYSAYPAKATVSPAEQRGVLDAACAHYGVGLTLDVPAVPWPGEVEKRTALFRLALAVSDPDDWWAIFDADMVAVEVPDDLHARLAITEAESAIVSIHDMAAAQAQRADWHEWFQHRCLFRAAPIEVRQNHYSYWRIGGHPLWSGTDPRGLTEPLDLTDMTVEHRPQSRPPARVLAQNQYYARRDREGLEMGTCPRCEQRQATQRVIVDLRLHGKQQLPVGGVNELCDECANKQKRQNANRLRHWGFDPDATRFNERYSMPR